MPRSPLRSLPVVATLVATSLGAQDAPVPPQMFDWFEGPVPAVTPWGQSVDTAATRLILSWTTAPEYTSPLVDHIPDHPSVPSPADHFGAPIGEPGTLHRTGEIHGYFRALAEATDRVSFRGLGETEEGNRLGLAVVGSAANLARLDEVRDRYRRLADPRVSDADAAEALVADLPAVYLITAGLHSTETGPPEMVMELGYRLAVSEAPEVQAVRDSVLVFIVPVTEPDGRNRVVDWSRVRYPTPDTTQPLRGPPYWGKYIYHDNNRDGLQLTARLTQEVVGLVNDWRIPIGHDLHESIPYLYTSTGTGPYNPTVDPITVAEWTWFANYEVTALTSLGMPGVWTHGFYDGWSPTYLLWATNVRNGLGRFYETFGNSVPWTRERTLPGRSTSVEWYRPNPPRDTTFWSLRNNTNYMQSGVLTALHLTAQNRTRLLRQYRTKTENALRKGRTEAPYAYVVPADQARKRDAAEMLRLLKRQGIEVHRATGSGAWERYDDPQVAGDGPDTVAVQSGDYVIRMDQPYRNFVLTLMRRQDYPADAPRPYDDVAWTFPLMFGATVHPIADPAVLGLDMEPVSEPAIPGSVVGAGDWWLIRPSASAFTLPARLALRDVRVWAAEDSVVVGDDVVPPGAWLVRARDVDTARIRDWAASYGMDVTGVDGGSLDVPRHELDVPRIAILHTWRSTQAEGWVRYTFDHFGVPYTYIADTELQEMGRLKRRFDVIVFPDQGGDARSIFQGLDEADGPLPYRARADAPSLGSPDATDDMTGGMRLEGLAALRDFVAEGGTFVGLRTAATLPVELGLVRDIGVRDAPDGLFIPGSVVKGEIARPEHPLAYGFPSGPALHHRFGPYLTAAGEAAGAVVVRYGDGDIGLSGLVQGGPRLAGEPAVLSVPGGDGHWVLFGFNPLNRHQNFMNFGFVWNAILNWDDLAAASNQQPDN
ncbi:MAG: M14 family zinc carboxypeptidase [Gemmatimonadota bacterium]